jgi:hypothetical protein
MPSSSHGSVVDGSRRLHSDIGALPTPQSVRWPAIGCPRPHCWSRISCRLVLASSNAMSYAARQRDVMEENPGRGRPKACNAAQDVMPNMRIWIRPGIEVDAWRSVLPMPA